jgi:hypothetical protein
MPASFFRFNSGSRTANFIWAHGGLLPLTKRPKAAWGDGRCPPRNYFVDQSSCLKRVLSVSQLLMLFAGRFFPKVSCAFRSRVSEATSPLHGAGGVVFGVHILWVSNSAPRRPLDASKGRPSLTSYIEIVSVPLWPKLGFTKVIVSNWLKFALPS